MDAFYRHFLRRCNPVPCADTYELLLRAVVRRFGTNRNTLILFGRNEVSVMLICNNCGRLFDESEAVRYRDSDTLETYSLCPSCGDYDSDIAVKCPVCGEYASENELDDNFGLCKECRNNTEKLFKNMMDSIFNAAQLECLNCIF